MKVGYHPDMSGRQKVPVKFSGLFLFRSPLKRGISWTQGERTVAGLKF